MRFTNKCLIVLLATSACHHWRVYCSEPPQSSSKEESKARRIVLEKVTGKLELKAAAQPGQPAEEFQGSLIAATEIVLLKVTDDELLAQLRAKAGKAIVLEGVFKEKNGQRYLEVTQLIERAQPPSGFRNPRGM